MPTFTRFGEQIGRRRGYGGSNLNSVLDWSRFRTGSVGPELAFEAFASQLFERWVRRLHGKDVVSYVLNGAGGDGGVEAFAKLKDGSVLGLQAKWFMETFDDPRKKKIARSLESAIRRHPSICNYVIALPSNLTTTAPPNKGGVERWEELTNDVRRRASAVVLDRWDMSGLLDQLAVPENHALRGLWFEGEGLTHSHLAALWERSKGALRQRYLPDLHAVGKIEVVLADDMFEAERVGHRRHALGLSREAFDDAKRRLSDIRLKLPEEPDLDRAVVATVAELDALLAITDELIDATGRGPLGQISAHPNPRSIYEVVERLNDLRNHSSGFPVVRVGNLALGALQRAIEAISSTLNAHRAWTDALRPRVVAGPPGCGKTHAAAHLVGRRLTAGAPAVFVAARDLNTSSDLRTILASVLDRPTWSLDQLLDGIEALGVLAQITMSGQNPDREFVRAILVLDGLEESTGWERWSERLAELATVLNGRPRIHLIALLRPEALSAIRPSEFASIVKIREDAGTDLPGMFRVYCDHYRVDVSSVPWFGWAVRSPLEVRLFAEEFADQRVTSEEGFEASITRLFARKLGRLELEARGKAHVPRWREETQLLLTVLEALVERSAEAVGGIETDRLVNDLQKRGREFDEARVDHALQVLVWHGLVDFWRPPSKGLTQPPDVYRPATRHLVDYVVARRAADRVRADINARGKAFSKDAPTRETNSAILMAALLAENGIFVVDDIWDGSVPDLTNIQVPALALVPSRVAERKRSWVKSLLLKSTPLNRMVIGKLLLRVSRIPNHPLAVHLLDESLREVPLAKRDPIWSVPEDLDGDAPWNGPADTVLDSVELHTTADDWNGRPLMVAWTCATVIELRRNRARERLAVWGSRRLDHMDRLLNHMARVDDPQVVEDVVVAALGAVLGAAYDDPALPDIARTVDRLFFASDAVARTPDVVVRVAARAIVERVNMLLPGAFEDPLARAQPPYLPDGGEWPELDPCEVQNCTHYGGRIVHGDLSWYVADWCFDTFQGTEIDDWGRPNGEDLSCVDHSLLQAVADGSVKLSTDISGQIRAELDRIAANPSMADILQEMVEARARREVESEEESCEEVEAVGEGGSEALSNVSNARRRQSQSNEIAQLFAHARKVLDGKAEGPRDVRNAMIAAHVRAWGWNEEEFSEWKRGEPLRCVDHAIASAHGQSASHGARNVVATFREKYVWAAVNHVAGQLADRLPVWDRGLQKWQLLTDLSDLGTGMPDPLPRVPAAFEGPRLTNDEAWVPQDLWPLAFVEVADLAERAERWVVDAPLPDPRRFVRAPIEGYGDAAVLAAVVARDGHQTCIDPCLWVSACGLYRKQVDLWKRDAPIVWTPDRFSESRVGLGPATYISAVLAAAATWLKQEGAELGHVSLSPDGLPVRLDRHPFVAEITTRDETEGREASAFLPAPILRDALRVVGAEGSRAFRRYLNGDRRPVAVERNVQHEEWGSFSHYLVADFTEFLSACGTLGLVPAWGVRYYREASGPLWFDGNERRIPPGLIHRNRNLEWLLVWNATSHDFDIVLIRDDIEKLKP